MGVGRRNVSMMRLGRCVAFLAAAAFLLPFTILLMVADQQYNITYNSKRVFYQEVRFLCFVHIYIITNFILCNRFLKYLYSVSIFLQCSKEYFNHSIIGQVINTHVDQTFFLLVTSNIYVF